MAQQVGLVVKISDHEIMSESVDAFAQAIVLAGINMSREMGLGPEVSEEIVGIHEKMAALVLEVLPKIAKQDAKLIKLIAKAQDEDPEEELEGWAKHYPQLLA